MTLVGGIWRVGSVAVECPTCRHRVPAEWSLCPRCGAPFRTEPKDNRIPLPASTHRPASTAIALQTRPASATAPALARTGGTSAPSPTGLAAIDAARRNGPPVAAPPPLVTRPGPTAIPPTVSPVAALSVRLGTIAARQWRRIVVSAVVGVALATSLVAVWPVLFRTAQQNSAPSTSVAQEAVATDLLKTVVGGERSYFAAHHTYGKATPATVSALSYRVPIVASTKTATNGTVSMRVNSASEITLATPADNERCVFVRDQPSKSKTQFVTLHTADCRANAAPASGWGTS